MRLSPWRLPVIAVKHSPLAINLKRGLSNAVQSIAKRRVEDVTGVVVRTTRCRASRGFFFPPRTWDRCKNGINNGRECQMLYGQTNGFSIICCEPHQLCDSQSLCEKEGWNCFSFSHFLFMPCPTRRCHTFLPCLRLCL